MHSIFLMVYLALDILKYVIIASAILSWLIAFDIINMRNDVARSIWRGLTAVTDPLLRPVRRFLPNLGGVDVSPIIVLLLIIGLQDFIARNFLGS